MERVALERLLQLRLATGLLVLGAAVDVADIALGEILHERGDRIAPERIVLHKPWVVVAPTSMRSMPQRLAWTGAYRCQALLTRGKVAPTSALGKNDRMWSEISAGSTLMKSTARFVLLAALPPAVRSSLSSAAKS
jgi:hypothetical protein